MTRPALSLYALLAVPLVGSLVACENASKLDGTVGISTATTSSTPVARTVDKPAKLEFFIMSKCPYGIQVEKAVTPALEQLGANVDFHITYIGQKSGDQLSSMHGPAEVTGDIAQLCARESSPDKYVKMIDCQNKDPQHIDTNWEKCASDLGIDTGAVKSCMSSKGNQLLAASFDEAQARGASGSPTMFLDGKPYNGGRKTKDFVKAICNTFDSKKPAACDHLPAAVAVNATFFSDSRCKKCNIDGLEGQLGGLFDGLKVKKVDYMTPEGKALYAELTKAEPSFKTLPTILFDETVNADKDGHDQIAKYLKPLGSYQTLALGGTFDPTAEICDNKVDDNGDGKTDCEDSTCKEAMACRPEVKNSIDLFVMSHCPYGTKALLATKEFADAFAKDATVQVHFIGDNANGALSSMHGPDEVSDDLREVCAIEHYAQNQKFLDFLACRSKNVKDDWKACTGASTGIDADVISKCADGDEGKGLLTASFKVASALEIASSPTFLVNNRETFNAQDAANIQSNFCKHNPGVAACSKQLTGTPPAPAGAGGGGGGAAPACGTN